jgi:O-antigen/teichoic acid export membrane protein
MAAATATAVVGAGDLGLGTTLTARMAAAPEDALRKQMAAMLAVLPVLMLTSAVGVFTFAMAGVGGTRFGLTVLLGIGATLECMAFLAVSPLRARGLMLTESAIRAAQGVLLLVGGVSLLAAGAGIDSVALLFPIAGMVSLAFAMVAVGRRFGIVRPSFDAPLLRALALPSLAAFSSTVVFFAYFRLDLFLLGHLRGDDETGVYGAAYAAAFGLAFVPAMFGRNLLPRLAAAPRPGELSRLHISATVNMGAYALVVCALLLAATPLLTVVFGSDYRGIVLPYVLLVVAQALYALTHINYVRLLACGSGTRALALTLLALGSNVSFNLIAIPAWGATGAAAAMCCSEALLLVAQLALFTDLGRPARPT